MKSSDASSHLFPLPFASNYVQNTINVYNIQQNIQLGELPAIEYLIRLKKKKVRIQARETQLVLGPVSERSSF